MDVGQGPTVLVGAVVAGGVFFFSSIISLFFSPSL